MTEDEADKIVETMFDEITKVETVNGKPRVTEEKTAAQIDAEEMEHAVEDFVRSWRRYREIERRSNDAALDPAHEIEWWRRVEALGLADARMKQAFLGCDRSPASIKQYAKFRRKMVTGERYRADA